MSDTEGSIRIESHPRKFYGVNACTRSRVLFLRQRMDIYARGLRKYTRNGNSVDFKEIDWPRLLRVKYIGRFHPECNIESLERSVICFYVAISFAYLTHCLSATLEEMIGVNYFEMSVEAD